MKRWVCTIFALSLTGCGIHHYTSHGTLDTEEGRMQAVLHWKEGDSDATLWRCRALQIPLSHGVRGHDPLQHINDRGETCIAVLVEDRPVTMKDLETGAEPVISVRCDGRLYPLPGNYPLSALVRRWQTTWAGLVEPWIPDACAGPP